MTPDQIAVNLGALLLIVWIIWYFWVSDAPE